MSNTNTTLATLAGGFVPMLLKNVLSSKGAKLSLKTVSFKGQIDEIIGEYKQFWPLTDLIIQRYVPGEDDDEEEENKADTSGQPDDEKLVKPFDAKRKMSVAVKSEQKVKPKDPPAEESKKKHTGGIHFSEDNDDAPRNDDKKNGLFRTSSALTNKSQDEDELVDLFIDLSVADTAGWSIYGSSESVASQSIMPGYFDPNNINEEYEDVPTSRQPVSGTPPDYARAVSVSYHPKSSV